MSIISTVQIFQLRDRKAVFNFLFYNISQPNLLI
jgi:hypothetical protein